MDNDDIKDNVIDLARHRRMRFEAGKTEKELALIDFDVYGNPIPLVLSDSPEAYLSRLKKFLVVPANVDQANIEPKK